MKQIFLKEGNNLNLSSLFYFHYKYLMLISYLDNNKNIISKTQ